MAKTKMICPNCGAEMNHHAMKIDYSEARDGEVIDGVTKEVHSCPHCHRTEFRKEEP
jgi:RNA polymerase subunit RPABC4/transcription elongation factor Spt4